MIQRIQTLYLLLIVALGIALCFLPVVQLTTPEEAAQQRMYELKAIGLEENAQCTMHNAQCRLTPETTDINGQLTGINGEKKQTPDNAFYGQLMGINGGKKQTPDNAFNGQLTGINGGEMQTARSEAGLNGLWGLLLTTLCIPVLALVDIFLYRKRILQARLNIFLAVLCVGYYGILAMFVWFAKMNLGTTEWHLYVWSGIPLICLVLTLMATRRILKDEALVRAADRIR